MVKKLHNLLISIGLYAFLGAICVAQDVDARSDIGPAETQPLSAVTIVSPTVESERYRPNPGDNFYLFANYSWVSQVEIPKNALSEGALNEARTRTRAQINQIETELLATSWPEGSRERNYQILYNTFLDERRVNRRGMSPIREAERAIRAARSHRDIALLLGDNRLGAGGLFNVSLKVSQIGGRPYIPRLALAQPLLGLSDTYLREDAEGVGLRARGADVLTELLRLGRNRRNARARVEAVLQLEASLASLAPSPAAERDPSHSHRLVTKADLAALAPDFPWDVYLQAQGLGGDIEFSLAPFGDLAAIGGIFDQTPVSVWRDYLRLRLLLRYGAYLPEEVAILTEEVSQLRSATVRPVPSRAERASRFAQWMLPDVLARKYVETHLSDETLKTVSEMAEQMRDVYRQRITASNWLSPDTREAALAKLETLEFMIGVPPDWNPYWIEPASGRDLFAYAYGKFLSRRESVRARFYERSEEGARDIATLRQNIFFSPLRVGAYYLPRLNAVILPAAYLQPPFFDPHAELAQNYGSLGTTIGHEIGHAFDDQGSRFGPTGEFENWWASPDRAQFETLAGRLASQFSGLEAAPGVPLDPQLTLGENVSDLAGIEMAHRAMLGAFAEQGIVLEDQARRSLSQTFFLSYADKRRRVRRPETDRQFAASDRHSPPELRTNIILSNIDAWYDAFDITHGDILWRAPEIRVTIW